MDTSTLATRELLARPDDEHHTLDSYRCAAEHDRAVGRELRLNPRAVLFSELDGARARVGLDTGAGQAYGLSHYALTQACGTAGTNPQFLARLRPETRARVLNEAMDRAELTDRLALLDTHTNTIRALTSTHYVRLWDADIMDEVAEWLLPLGWIPAVPTFRSDANGTNMRGNTKPALFRGDRDSFTFFYSPQSTRSDLGGLRSGLMIGNSEVGARSFFWDAFTFRDVCGNFMVHGIADVQRNRARHVGDVRSLFRDLRLFMQRYSLSMDSEQIRQIEDAANKMFAEEGQGKSLHDNTIARLTRQYKTTGAIAGRIAEAADLPVNRGDGQNGGPGRFREMTNTYFTVANGASWLAHGEKNADDKAALAVLSGKILAGAGA